MKKAITIALIIISTTLFSFVNQEKKIKFEFTLEETQLIFDALGELPAKKVEALRGKIIAETQRQLADTIKKK